MRVLFSTIRNTGHFLPLVPFIEACLRRGHEVAVAAPSELAERVAKTKAQFFAFGHPGDAGLRPLWERMRAVDPSEVNQFVVREIFADACAGAALPSLLETLAAFRPAIVVRESQEYGSLVAAAKLGVAHAHVAITLPSAEPQMFQAALPVLEVHARAIGVAPERMRKRLFDEAALTMFPASLEDAGWNGSHTLRYRSEQSAHEPLPDYWRGRTGPIVYLTLGTVAGGMAEMRAAYRAALDAVGALPVRVLLTVGNELPIESLGALPSNVHAERFVPQDQVLAQASAVICHGGSGTTLGTLAAGVPLVIMPLFADQPKNAERVAAVGAGVALPTLGATPETVRAALTRVLDDGAFRAAAQRVAAEMAALPRADDAPADLERLAR